MNYKRIKFLTIVFFLVNTLIGCKNFTEEDNLNNIKQTETLNQEYSVKNEKGLNMSTKRNYFFLTLYEDMLFKDYKKEMNILIEKGVFEFNSPDYYYISGDCRTLFDSKFVNDKLKEVSLIGVECLYPLFVKKYNLPEMIEKKLHISYVENNPDYKLNSTYSKFERLPAFQDPAERMKPGERIYFSENELTKVLPKNYQIILKDSVVIEIFQEFSENPIGDLKTSSLIKSMAYQEYCKSEKRNGLFMDPEESAAIINNSKLIYVSEIKFVETKIIYKPISVYKKELEIRNDNNELKQKEKLQKEKRSKDVFNEI